MRGKFVVNVNTRDTPSQRFVSLTYIAGEYGYVVDSVHHAVHDNDGTGNEMETVHKFIPMTFNQTHVETLAMTLLDEFNVKAKDDISSSLSDLRHLTKTYDSAVFRIDDLKTRLHKAKCTQETVMEELGKTVATITRVELEAGTKLVYMADSIKKMDEITTAHAQKAKACDTMSAKLERLDINATRLLK